MLQIPDLPRLRGLYLKARLQRNRRPAAMPIDDDNPLLDIRRKNLRDLREQRGAASLAKALGLANTTYLSQLVNKHRVINERTARLWEKKLGMQTAWFDKDHSAFEGPAPLDIDLYTRINEVIDRVSVGRPLTHKQRGTILTACLSIKRADEPYIRMLVSLTQS